MLTTFKFKKEKSPLLGVIYRPIVTVFFLNKNTHRYQPVKMIVDTGADYTLLPRFLAFNLGINLIKDCKKLKTSGVGGKEIVYFYKKKAKIRLGNWMKNIPLGFLDNDYLPPLLGRHRFLEEFKVIFDRHQLNFIKSY
jgi:predicted aspartyl protease